MKPIKSLACVLALVFLGLSLAAVPAQAAAANISLSPAQGPAGTTVTVTGTGFPKKSSGTLNAGISSAAFKVSASGYFTAAVVIPQTTQPALDVHATAGTVRASAAFTIVAAPVTDPAPPAISSSPLRRRHPGRAAGIGGTGPGRVPRRRGAVRHSVLQGVQPGPARSGAGRGPRPGRHDPADVGALGLGRRNQPACLCPRPRHRRRLRPLSAAVGRGPGVLGASGDAALRARDERELVSVVRGRQRQRTR